MRQAAALPSADQDLVLVGGGHSHVAVIRHFGMRPERRLRVTMVTREVMTPYSGMLPGLVAGHYSYQDCHIDLRALCTWAGVRLIHDTVTGIDLQARRLNCQQRPPLRYDWLSLNTGSRPALDDIPGATGFGIAVRPIDRFAQHVDQLISSLGEQPRPLRLAVVGGGAAGVEIALSLHFRLRRDLPRLGGDLQMMLLTREPVLLCDHNVRVRARIAREFTRHAIPVHTDCQVVNAGNGMVHSADGRHWACDDVVWAIHAGAGSWSADSGLACNARGFVRVDHCLRSISHPNVFASGDMAALPTPVAKSGVYAVRQGPVLARNLRAVATDGPLRRYRAQRQFLKLLVTGDQRAVASRGVLSAAGHWVWRWKDYIDRTFMARYAVAPVRPVSGEAPQMRCGGCGAKIGAAVLQSALGDLNSRSSPLIPIGLDARDDAAVVNVPPGKQLVQSVDFIRAFVDDPWLLGRIAVFHCCNDLHAMGATPHSAMALAALPHAADGLVGNDLRQLMQGAASALHEEHMILLGGHSSEAAEAGFGLAVNGWLEPGTALRKGPLAAGQALIVTRAIGSGSLLAANMLGQARGDWIETVLAEMQTSQGTAVRIARAHGLSACTDVTGFGLLGHLAEMLRGATQGATLTFDAVPQFAGAMSCLERGFFSSLAPSNSEVLCLLDSGLPDIDSRLQLLVDPQTAGGMLLAVPLAAADHCVVALRDAGYAATCSIGHTDTTVAPGRIRLVL